METILHATAILAGCIQVLLQVAIGLAVVVFILVVVGTFLHKLLQNAIELLVSWKYQREVNKIRIEQQRRILLGPVSKEED